ncbi:CheR family methyltransferase [Pseudoduganella aquatica]|uniref:Chemotaxis protein n=1 Tax=Pseudoduganella aquatica TaxID=2660641 RepID=A0A7X4H7Z8_9BURK|nr:CheR family methyltransferase [Pseudoduganella aquatica]MYN06361.1 chemotaxis protein [Pseudoduganella aquatica]
MGNVTPMRHEAAPEVEELELDLLAEALFQRYGYDFRGHERTALRRKLRALLQQRSLRTLSALQGQVLHDPRAASAVLRALHVPSATMFDDAEEARLLRQASTACLSGAALPKVWLADCAGAEQAWTLAVLLAEQGLLARTELHCTVASDELLAEAQDHTIPLERLAEYQASYDRAGAAIGSTRLADYFHITGQRAVLLPQLRSRISWAQYNLVTDASFNEFNLIVCRRALPDFGPLLRQRVLQLFHASLAPFGLLALDRQFDENEALAAFYRPLLPMQPLYKRVA